MFKKMMLAFVTLVAVMGFTSTQASANSFQLRAGAHASHSTHSTHSTSKSSKTYSKPSGNNTMKSTTRGEAKKAGEEAKQPVTRADQAANKPKVQPTKKQKNAYKQDSYYTQPHRGGFLSSITRGVGYGIGWGIGSEMGHSLWHTLFGLGSSTYRTPSGDTATQAPGYAGIWTILIIGAIVITIIILVKKRRNR